MSYAFIPGPLLNAPWLVNPFGVAGAAGGLTLLLALSNTAAALTLLLAAGSLVVRFRRARGDERQQVKWVALGAAVWTLAWAAAAMTPQPWVPVVRVVYVFALAFIAGCFGLAILKHRLYDVDRVITRTLAYGALAVTITAGYVGVVAGLGALAGGGGQSNLGVALPATALAAAFQPLRVRLVRLASRLVYGQRASPYEVLAGFSRRLTGALSVDEVLPRLAEAAARGVGAERAAVRVSLTSGREQVVTWPDGAGIASFDRAVPVRHQGEPVGEIGVAKPPGERLTPAEEALLRDLAAQAGPALSNVLLALELRTQAEALRASRQRLVVAQDAERRRLERDLHDGAQQHLVALAVNLQVTQELVRTQPDQAAALLAEARGQAREALATLRDLARGIYPPVLADRGLAAALEAHVAKVCPSVALAMDPSVAAARFAPELEAAVYFCCLEALQNAAKHAPGAPVAMELSHSADWLTFAVRDGGRGFDARAAPRGAGLENMADRLAALDGSLELRSLPGGGTTVAGRVPAQPLAPLASQPAPSGIKDGRLMAGLVETVPAGSSVTRPGSAFGP